MVAGLLEAPAGGPLVGLHVVDADLGEGDFRPGGAGGDALGATRRRWREHALSDPRVRRLLRDVAATGEAVHDVRHELPAAQDGDSPVPLTLTVVPLREADGSVPALALVAVDRTREALTERRVLVDRARSRLGDSLDVLRTAQTLAEVAVPVLADVVTVDILDSVLHGEAPPPGPLTEPATVRRAGFASRGTSTARPTHEVGSVRVMRRGTPHALALSDLEPRIVPFLDSDAAWLTRDPARAEAVRKAGVHSALVVPLAARGVVLGIAVLCRASTPEAYTADDAELVAELCRHAALGLDNARLHTRERTTARIAQHALLPRRTDTSVAVEAVHTHLPGSTVGSWYDVIRLSGARVALVAGEIRGEGLHAATAMGQLRTAVHAFSALDLDPAELLGRLDMLATRLAFEQADPGSSPAPGEPPEDGPLSATCLYVLYDAVDGTCEAASAAHAAPLLAEPGRAPVPLTLTAGPVLGRGAGSYLAARRDVAPGSRLALYSRGLLEGRTAGEAELARLLAEQSAQPLRSACDNVVGALVAQDLTADALLLLARTRLLEPGEETVTWTLPNDPRSAGKARRSTREQLARWDLDGLAPTMELIVTELVTNAVRYAEGDLTLRLIRAETLICEVEDSNDAAPRLRMAEDTDEGGRGLFMVGRIGRNWGVRQTAQGKILWVDLPLPEATREPGT